MGFFDAVRSVIYIVLGNALVAKQMELRISAFKYFSALLRMKLLYRTLYLRYDLTKITSAASNFLT